MFDFLKRSKGPSPIFSSIGTDIHCHLVPQVDDGSKSLEETIECLHVLQDVGFKKVYITPHFCFPRFPNQEEDIERRFENLKKEIKEKDPSITIQLAGIGGEYRVDDGFEKRTKEGAHILKTANDKLLLIELSLHQQRMGLEETIFDLQMKGHELVLAHPERYPYYGVHSGILGKLKEQGVYFQINILSLSGFYGEGAQKRAFDYLEEGWVDFLGTDMHNTLYAKALSDASNNRKVRQVLEKYKFLNSEY